MTNGSERLLLGVNEKWAVNQMLILLIQTIYLYLCVVYVHPIELRGRYVSSLTLAMGLQNIEAFLMQNIL